jgi:hypothetical protein
VELEQRYVAFASWTRPRVGLEIRVNFGLFAGREATPAELDELGRRLLGEVDAVSLVAERRHELSAQVEASVHQVRIEVEPSALPKATGERKRLAARIADAAERWASACVADRSAFATGM